MCVAANSDGLDALFPDLLSRASSIQSLPVKMLMKASERGYQSDIVACVGSESLSIHTGRSQILKAALGLETVLLRVALIVD